MMKTWTDIGDLSEALTGCVVTLGNFDGVHLGHRAILRETVLRARQGGLPSVAITFHPHPSVVVGYPSPPLLTSPAQRGRWIAEEKIDHFLVQSFTRELSEVSAEDFVANELVGKLKARALCIGPNTHLGRKREGTPERLKVIATNLGIDCWIVPSLSVDHLPVSSSRIRELVAKGDVEKASQLLGRPHCTEGRIVAGENRGASLGFPTANLGDVETLLPPIGVYATRVHVGGALYSGATNVGVRPTFESAGKQVVETHIIDFLLSPGSLYEQTMEIEWLKFLRPEKKFQSAEELKIQIAQDVKVARATAQQAVRPGAGN